MKNMRIMRKKRQKKSKRTMTFAKRAIARIMLMPGIIVMTTTISKINNFTKEGIKDVL